MSGLMVEYGWALMIIIALEGLLAADNALVMAVMVKHLDVHDIKKALFYGLAGAFVFRFLSLFLISFVIDLWEIQAIGALYLLYMSGSHLWQKMRGISHEDAEDAKNARWGSGFWATVLKIELADIAFAVDSILAAVALVLSLPGTTLPTIGGMDGGKFAVVFIGGFVGLICVRFAATYIIQLLRKRPGLETAAYAIVGWVGVKLAVMTLVHRDIALLPAELPHSLGFKVVFWGVLISMAVIGWVTSKEIEVPDKHATP